MNAPAYAIVTVCAAFWAWLLIVRPAGHYTPEGRRRRRRGWQIVSVLLAAGLLSGIAALA